MVVRLRLAVHGKRNDRIFHIVAINGRNRRNAKPIETLGVFRARSPTGGCKTVEWNPSGIKKWLDTGAQPSERVVRLLELGQILPPDSKWHPAKRRTPAFNVINSEEHIRTAGRHIPGAKFDVFPSLVREPQPKFIHQSEMPEKELSPEEEVVGIMNRMLKK